MHMHIWLNPYGTYRRKVLDEKNQSSESFSYLPE